MLNVEQRLKELKDCGSKVRVNHYRNYLNLDTEVKDEDGQMEMWVELSHKQLRNKKEKGEYIAQYLSNKGGRTTLDVTLPDGTEIKTEAKCCAKDNFSRKLGKKICYNRFLVEYNKYLAGSPEATKYGNLMGGLLSGMYYLAVVEDTVYEVYPATNDIEQEVVESSSRAGGFTLKEFERSLKDGTLKEIKTNV